MRHFFLNGKFCAQRTTGVQRYARGLVEALDAELADAPGRDCWQLLLPPGAKPPPLRSIGARFVDWSGPAGLHGWEQLALPRAARAGILVTRALLFAGEGYGGQPVFRAYDKATGEIVWEAPIPGGEQTGLPMSYLHDGRQFIVFAAAGNPATRTSASLVAYALAR